MMKKNVGWANQSKRHSNAKKYGVAGGKYATPKKRFKTTSMTLTNKANYGSPALTEDDYKFLESESDKIKSKPVKEEKSLNDIMKNKFENVSNQALVDRINSKYKRGQNDDDEVFELARRRDEGLLDFKTGFDTYELINKTPKKPKNPNKINLRGKITGWKKTGLIIAPQTNTKEESYYSLKKPLEVNVTKWGKGLLHFPNTSVYVYKKNEQILRKEFSNYKDAKSYAIKYMRSN